MKGLSWKQHGEQIKQVIGVQPQSSAAYSVLVESRDFGSMGIGCFPDRLQVLQME
ncbi:hypothetical protein [Paenibacillus sp. GP183]|uniref:hypothetical protein n=1 Tax=Paenibacillus sp. GP183 TaxID=1882751 RepID=UPI001495D820|nr:hypothetical protein [Paenibacillus sp. GP183]